MLPIDPTDSSDPGGPITWPPQRPPSKLGGHRVDLRLRPIPLSPEEVRRRVLRAGSPVPQGFSGPFLDILRVPACRPQGGSSSSTEIGPSSTANCSACGLRRPPSAQPAAPRRSRRHPRRSRGSRWSASLGSRRSIGSRRGEPGVPGNGRRALVGMSYKGPSAGERLGQARGPLHRPVLVTLPIDPADSSDPGGPVTWPPRCLSQQAGRPPCGSSSPADPALPGGSA